MGQLNSLAGSSQQHRLHTGHLRALAGAAGCSCPPSGSFTPISAPMPRCCALASVVLGPVRAVLLLYSLSAVQQTCAAIGVQPSHCDTAHQFLNTKSYILGSGRSSTCTG
jgi:hypothetical protein